MGYHHAENNWQKRKILQSKEHQNKAFQEINGLTIKKRDKRKVVLSDGRVLTEFVSCSYLGLDQDRRVIEATMNNLYDCGVTFPAARTRIQVESFVVLEELLSKIFCNSFCVVFANLHQTHLGFLPLLASGEVPSYPICNNGVRFILDKTVHASVQINRGLMLQFGEVVSINFNQIERVENEFKKAFGHNQTPIAIADSIGSMGGLSHIVPLFEFAEKYNGYVYLDDAHGTSIFGKNGCGYVLNLLNHIYHPRLILTSSLSKAFGAIGGVLVLPTKKDIDVVKQFCLTYIFGGPPALAIINSAIAAAEIHLSPEIYELQQKLQDRIAYFDSLMNEYQIVNYKSCSPIRGVRIGDELKTISAALKLRKNGFAVTAAMYPAVAKEHGILRLAFGTNHTHEDIMTLCESIKGLT
jgi:7-keto-8-aminopelargonate synthetase-like enzyme